MTRRHDSKISAIFWGIILIFPFIWFLFSFIAFSQPFSDSSVPIDSSALSGFLESFFTSNVPLTIFTDSLFDFYSLFFTTSEIGPFFLLLFFFVSYYIIVHFIRLVTDVLLFIPHLFHSWISKFDRKVE